MQPDPKAPAKPAMPPRTVEFLLAALDAFERAAREAKEKACR